MTKTETLLKPSLFIQKHTPFFLSRFKISYTQDESEIEYCISEIKTKKNVSCSIEISMDADTKRINVLMFYPGLDQLLDTHYFSSVCFFLIIHHFTQFFHLSSQYSICLKTKKIIFNSFYSHCDDFKFILCSEKNNEMVNITSFFKPLGVDVSMISEKKLGS